MKTGVVLRKKRWIGGKDGHEALSSRNRLPEKLETIGDHLLRRRLALKVIQRQVAAQLGVAVTSLRTWEANQSRP